MGVLPIRVAVFEDNPELRDGLYQLINETSGYQCVGAFPNCDSLVENIDQSDPDVVLMDIGMPGMSGIEGVRLLKSRFPKINVLMQTVYEDDERIFNSICAGASGYLLKKTPPSKILEAITEIFNGGAPMTSKIARRVVAWMQNQNTAASAMGFELSEREKNVLNGLIKGLSYKMIAEEYFISIDTVRSHIKNIYEKLHVHTKSEAVAKAMKHRLV